MPEKLTSEHLLLRALEPEDLDVLYRWENDPSIWGEGSMIPPFSRYDLKQYITNAQDIYSSRNLRLVVEERTTKQVVGMVDLFDFEPIALRVEMGILIFEDFRGKGYAKETLELVRNYVFGFLRCHQLVARASVKNEASLRLFRESGFTEAGLLKDWVRDNALWCDCMIFQLINK